MMMELKCEQCGETVETVFHENSGGLCGYCLADYGMPLTEVRSGEDAAGALQPMFDEIDRQERWAVGLSAAVLACVVAVVLLAVMS